VAKLLGALVNLVSVKSEAREKLVQLKTLPAIVALLNAYQDVEGEASMVEDSAFETSLRAGVTLSKVLGDFPDALEADEGRVLRFVEQVLTQPATLASLASRQETNFTKLMDVAVRLLTQLLTRSAGALRRLAEAELPKIEEIADEDAERIASADEGDATLPSLETLTGSLLAALQRLKPMEYVSEEEAAVFGMLRGNLALLFGHLVTEQAKPEQPQPLRDLNLKGCVGIFIECLRRERAKSAQHNAGVCVTKLAASERYREAVRNLHGFESLHQIQLANQEKKKESDVLISAKAKAARAAAAGRN
jgi:hypothetical protein